MRSMTAQTPQNHPGDDEFEAGEPEYDLDDPDAGINPEVVPVEAAAREPEYVLDDGADDLDDFDGGF